MADNTLVGVSAIVIVVVVAALAITGLQAPNQGAAVAEPEQAGPCDAARLCDGSKLVIIREDCSVAQSFCQRGCNSQLLTCN